MHSKAEPSLKQSFSPQVFAVLLSPLIDIVQSQAAPGSQEENSTNRVNISRGMVARMPERQAVSDKRAQKVSNYFAERRRRSASNNGNARKKRPSLEVQPQPVG